LREYDAGTPITELARKHAVHANTLRLWKSKYGGLDVSDMMRLKELEDENRRRRRVIANRTLENDAMKELASITLEAFTARRSGEGSEKGWFKRTRRLPTRAVPARNGAIPIAEIA